MRKLSVVYIIILIIFVSVFALYCITQPEQEVSSWRSKNEESYDIWIMFVRVSKGNTRTTINNFQRLVRNILNMTSVPISFHFIIDDSSKEQVLSEMKTIEEVVDYSLYDVEQCKKQVRDLSGVLMPHISQSNHAYFQDEMFYISLGLHRIAPNTQTRAVMLDCDVLFRQDVRFLFDEFKKFDPGTLFGIGFELSPLYHNMVGAYRSCNRGSTFGTYYRNEIISKWQPHPKGFPGYNSGVVLFDFEAIRQSKKYKNLFEEKAVNDLFAKYRFKGFLGDQDFYTLIGYEHPHLIYTLNCGFNRQLCRKLRTNANRNSFDFYFKCDFPVVVWHGNCKSQIPVE